MLYEVITIVSVAFDRGGYLYHGRVKALADGGDDMIIGSDLNDVLFGGTGSSYNFV